MTDTTKPNFKAEARQNRSLAYLDAMTEEYFTENRAYSMLLVAEEEERLRYAYYKAQGNQDVRMERSRRKLFEIRVALKVLRFGVDEEPSIKVTSPSGCNVRVTEKEVE